MNKRPHEGQILRISDLESEARVTGAGRNQEGDSDYFSIQEIWRDDKPRGLGGCYGYYRKDGSEQWTDCNGEPVTVELLRDAPVPRVIGYERFFDETLIAICEGFGVVPPRMAKTFAEILRNHVATEHCSDQWRKLALATLRGARSDFGQFMSTLKFIDHINELDQACFDIFKMREDFYAKKRSA
jgi:hypothetical protein